MVLLNKTKCPMMRVDVAVMLGNKVYTNITKFQLVN